MGSVTQDELMDRIGKLQHCLRSKEIDLAILNVNSDLHYYTGSVQPLYLLVPAESAPLLLARKALQRIREEAAHIKLEPFNGTKDLIRIIEENGFAGIKKIGLTFETTAYATVKRWQQLFGNVELVDLSWDIKALRMVKSETEIAIQTRAGTIMAELPALIRKNFSPGMTELELSAIIENYFRLNGHGVLVRCRREGIEMTFGVCSAGINTLAGTKFDGICAGIGVSTAVPYGACYDPIDRGTPVLLDYAYNLEGYHIDQTRMFSWGSPLPEVIKAYDAMLQVEKHVISLLNPGRNWEDVYEAGLQLAIELGYEKEFMGLGPEKVKFVGHGLGLELDEPPFLAPKKNIPLVTGMVVAVEPKVSLPGIGVIGVEDTLVIREGNPEVITIADNQFLII